MGTVSLANRYAVIRAKFPREIILLRGNGCKWRRCSFCDYHLDFSLDEAANYELNRQVIGQVTGSLGRLEVINSGSFCDLDTDTIALLEKVCREKKINTVCFESHWLHRELIPAWRERFQAAGVAVKMKIGVESFEEDLREEYLRKGMGSAAPEEIAAFFDQVCLLQGLQGQTAASMVVDIETGLKFFERVCVNVMNDNSTSIKPCPATVKIFRQEVLPLYEKNARVDILLNNTDFGVGN